MQNDQEYDLLLEATDDGGTLVDLDNFGAVASPEGIVTLEVMPHSEVGKYGVTIRGIADVIGSAQVTVTGTDGENVFTFIEDVSTTDNLGEGFTGVTRSEIRNQP